MIDNMQCKHILLASKAKHYKLKYTTISKPNYVVRNSSTVHDAIYVRKLHM